MPRQSAKEQLEEYIAYGFGTVEREYRFDPERRWRADYALLDQTPPVLIEYEGLMRHNENHGHASISGIIADIEKHNAAQALGYRVFRAHAKSIQSRDRDPHKNFLVFLNQVLEHI